MKKLVNTVLSNKLYLIYAVLFFISLISMLFTNISYDGEYQVAMAYRFLKGDKPLIQMWEPHQTSIFLCAILMKLYITVVGSATGIMIYLQLCGLFIRSVIGFLFAKTICRYADRLPGIAVFFMYIMLSPKDLLTPEFSNMQFWFGTLVLLSMIQYFDSFKRIWLILSAVSLCLAVLSYPSMLLLYFGVSYILLRYSEKAKTDLLLFTIVCAAIGSFFLVYLFATVDFETAIICLKCALSIEPSHTVNLFDKTLGHIQNLCLILARLGVMLGIAFVLQQLQFFLFKTKDRSGQFHSIVFYSWLISLTYLLYFVVIAENRGAYGYPLALIMIYGFVNRKLLTKSEQKFYNIALIVALSNLFATLLLSDHPFLQAVPYMLTFVCASVLPIYKRFLLLKDNKTLRKIFVFSLHMFFLVIVFRNIYLHTPISQRSQINTIIDENSFIRTGPLKFIYTNDSGAAMHRDSYIEWQKYISDGDKVWIMAEPCDTMGYLYKDVEVSAPTVMSTPTYNESLEYYFQVNPDKMPDVIVLSSYCGTLSDNLVSNDWILNWIETKYQPAEVIDGIYWRYYFKNPR